MMSFDKTSASSVESLTMLSKVEAVSRSRTSSEFREEAKS